MAEPSPALLATIRTIDRFTDSTGTIISWLAIPLVLAVGYEVFARYLMNAPTIWVYDVTYMAYGTLFMLGAAYALHKGAHIRTDFFWEQFSTRKKGVIDTIAYLVFFFPSLAILLVISGGEALYLPSGSTSCRTRRRGGRSCGRSRRWCRSPASS
ncbi:MAG: TRAP transporter small permease subunit [Xanthobacteraceae bacterium]|nr:TRAP transporter small permease subunit [Xanthobacteraceae bacterium]